MNSITEATEIEIAPEEANQVNSTPTDFFCIEEGKLTFVWLATPVADLVKRGYEVYATDFNKRQLCLQDTLEIYNQLKQVFEPKD